MNAQRRKQRQIPYRNPLSPRGEGREEGANLRHFASIESTELDALLDRHITALKSELASLNDILTLKMVNPRGRGQLKRILGQLTDLGEGNIFVAKEKNELIAYVLVTKKFYPIEDPNVCGAINGIFFKKAHRWQGIATKLFDMATNWLKKRGVKYIGCITS